MNAIKMKYIYILIAFIVGIQCHIALASPYNGVIEVKREDSLPFPPEDDEIIDVYSLSTVNKIEEDKTIEDKILEKFGDEGELALAIAKAESGLNPLAMNTNANTGDYSIGLYQINLIGKLFEGRLKRARHLGYTGEATREALTEWLQDEDNNIEYAYSMSRTNGWTAWSTYKRGDFNKFLN